MTTEDPFKDVNVLVEGCDCTGKTTLVQKIKENHGVSVHKTDAPSDWMNGLVMNYGLLKKLNKETGVVYDRSFIGEAVYGPLMRGYNPLYIRALEQQLKNNTEVLVVLTANEDTLRERFDGEYVEEDQLVVINNAFIKEFWASSIPYKLKIDTTTLTGDEVYHGVKRFIEEITEPHTADFTRCIQ